MPGGILSDQAFPGLPVVSGRDECGINGLMVRNVRTYCVSWFLVPSCMLFRDLGFKIVQSSSTVHSVPGQPLLTRPLASSEHLSCENSSLDLEPHTKGQCQAHLSVLVNGGDD